MFHSLSLVLVLFLRFFEPIEQHSYLKMISSLIYSDAENKSKSVVADLANRQFKTIRYFGAERNTEIVYTNIADEKLIY